MQMEIVSRECIKPCTPTPPHLRIHHLSFIDHIVFRNYVPLLFFYYPKNKPHHNYDQYDFTQFSKISKLKKSLSQVLSRYYPFAGRFKDQLSIECNDQGVSFLVANIKGIKLSAILQNPKETLLSPLFPNESQWKIMDWSESIVSIQINCFPCGGMAISFCMCHKIVDASTAFNFINDWATMNREDREVEEALLFPLLNIGASVFPQANMPIFPELSFEEDKTVVCRRFVFEASKIKSLKAMVMVPFNGVQNPSRVEVVTALIYKRAVSTLGLTFKMTSFRMAVDLRKRMVPPLPNECIGNMVWNIFVTNPVMDNRETELRDLVSKIKEELYEFTNVVVKKIGGKEKDLLFITKCLKQAITSVVNKESCECGQTLFKYSSWCRFSTYEADFGWGKPVWVTTSACPLRNVIFLMDTRDGNGIEALVNMEEQDMEKFECDVELLQYASLNINRLDMF